MGKMGSICHFPCALPAGIWGTLLSSPFFLLAFGALKQGCDNDFFRAVFSQHLGILRPPNTAKQGKTQNDKSTLFCPPTGGHATTMFLEGLLEGSLKEVPS